MQLLFSAEILFSVQRVAVARTWRGLCQLHKPWPHACMYVGMLKRADMSTRLGNGHSPMAGQRAATSDLLVYWHLICIQLETNA